MRIIALLVFCLTVPLFCGCLSNRFDGLVLPYDAAIQKGDTARPPATRAYIESLIAQLNSSVPESERPRSLAAYFNHPEQQRVECVIDKLRELGKDAFPILIEHVNDEGYSRTNATSSYWDSTVGYECERILVHQVEDVAGVRYKGRVGADGKPHGCHTYFGSAGYPPFAYECTQDGLRKWWSENHLKSLPEMQLEALRWTIENELRIGFTDERQKEQVLTPLEKQLAHLLRDAQAVPRKST